MSHSINKYSFLFFYFFDMGVGGGRGPPAGAGIVDVCPPGRRRYRASGGLLQTPVSGCKRLAQGLATLEGGFPQLLEVLPKRAFVQPHVGQAQQAARGWEVMGSVTPLNFLKYKANHLNHKANVAWNLCVGYGGVG